MRSNQTTVRVYYSDTDHGGVVYYANFLRWFEIGRTELLRQECVDYEMFERRGLIAPVVDVQCAYRFPARYNDVVEIVTEIEHIGNSSLIFKYKIARNDDKKILAEGKTTNVFIDKETLRTVPVPEEIRDVFSD